MSNDSLWILSSLSCQLAELHIFDGAKLDSIKRRLRMVIRRTFGEGSSYIADVDRLIFHAMVSPCTDELKRKCWTSGCSSLGNIITTIEEEISVYRPKDVAAAVLDEEIPRPSEDVFIVHGHDEEMKLDVARTVEKLGLTPIILHEQPNRGRTIIEKFTDHANVGFAIVLLSPDDLGRSAKAPSNELMERARQNVILELGYFFGVIGRGRVLPLYRPSQNFELPNDLAGVVYVAFDDAQGWRIKLVQELQAAGYAVDANDLV